MKYLDQDINRDMEGGDEAGFSTEQLEHELAGVQRSLAELPSDADPVQRAELQNRLGEILIDLRRTDEAFDTAREAFDTLVAAEQWEGAVQACNVMFLADKSESLAALGQGVWLAVTFPVDPELTVAMLQHIIDETPADSDGAAVSAAVAHYVVDMRAEGKQRDNLMLFTSHMMGSVARRHSEVEKQEQFDYWMEKLELNDPALFLPRMRNVIDVMVQEDWWVDREAIWASLPE